ncbi:hypothetical protein [Streptomyces sp. NPDC000410]|uniref:hypothetical protein n=1 Tax=Streptomyces sp. NPDC000410 TaxID=3154254 RepID=UPI00331A8575
MLRLSRRTVSTALVSVLTVAGVAFAQGPAVAAPEEVSVYTTDGDPGGMSNWNGDKNSSSSAEVWNACDHDRDGYRAVTFITYSGTTWEIQDADGDNGNCALTDDVNFPEGATVKVTACLRNGANGTPKFCASTQGRA